MNFLGSLLLRLWLNYTMSSKKKVLIITYYWPPAGGSGVQRWLKFVKYLRDFNIEPIVYTVDNPSYPILDKSLESEIPKDLEILKQPIFEPNSILSFFGNKTITTGEGGMVSTNDKNIYRRLTKLKNQAISSTKTYYHDEIGFNYRMTNIAASIGVAQLDRAPNILEKKKKLFDLYQERLNHLPLQFQHVHGTNISSYWMVTIIIDEDFSNNCLMEFLFKNGIETRPLFYPIHTMPPYKENEIYNVAEYLSGRGLSLPSYPELTSGDINYICSSINDFFNNRK